MKAARLICIIGAECTGKTTLARALAEHFDCPWVPEYLRDFCDAHGIEIGKRLQEMKYLWFEEPCPWEELSETKKVADALEMKVAFGEQDSSLWLFQWMIENKVMDVVQPDLNYNGGFIRAARVARMARQANMWICPHNTQ